VFVRGTLNDWGTRDAFEYIGEGEYRIAIALSAGDYEFKIASEDWSTVDYGGVGESPVVMVGEQSLLEAVGANITLNIAEQGNYTFAVIGPDRNNVKVLISKN